MTFLRSLFSALLLMLAAGLISEPAFAGAGGEKCLECHDEEDEPSLLISRTKHRTEADDKSASCMACHGESKNHMTSDPKFKGRRPTDIQFKVNGVFPLSDVNVRNTVCLKCHEKDSRRMLWMGSSHDTRDVACTSCHQIHTTHDKVTDKRTQPNICFNCHKEQRAQIHKPSRHPIPEGKMGCGDCHNVHGAAGPKLMKRDSIVETCYTCHMEKRGPFVHNHEPVNEDCSICHNAHGTTAESMLKMRPPFLCHNCHTPHGGTQPLLAGQGAAPGVAGWSSGSIITQGRSCMNCHTQVHGSNNPSPASPTPRFLFR